MERRNACLLAFLGVAAVGLLLTGIALSLWVSSRAGDGNGEGKSEPEKLAAGAAHEGSIDLQVSHERIFVIEVPERTIALRLDLASHDTELLLEASREEKDGGPDGEEDWDFTRASESGKAELTIGRFSEPAIEAGRYRVRVAWTSDVLPRTVEKRLEKIPFTIQARVVPTRIDGVLEPGKAAASVIDEESGGFRSFTIVVPKGARALRIDLLDVASDLDLYARRGGPIVSVDDDVYFAEHDYGRETLVIGGGEKVIEAGTWYVDAVDVVEEEGPVPFRILATLAEEAPAEILGIPPIPAARGAAPVARALSAVVEIETDGGIGSGTILTSDGWILTNAHVVEELGGGDEEEVVVSASMDPALPPVEMFRAKVEAVDSVRDLALVHVVSGFYGQPLPRGYEFPTVEMGGESLPAIGDPIWLVGYPSTGGQGSRVSITCTRGVVSGYDTVAFGPVIKTDAEITNGNSGGAALDEKGRILGVPTSMVESGSGQVAYVHPLGAMPKEWREKIRAGAKR